MSALALTKEETIELLATIKLEAGHYAKLPIDITNLDRAIEAARGGDLKPAEKMVDQVAGVLRGWDMDDDGDKKHKELYLHCLEFIHT